jgi:hypothetical protein
MATYTCRSCGQDINSDFYQSICAICLQTEAIEEQTQLLRQIHNVPEPVNQTEPAIDRWDDGAVIGLIVLILWITGLLAFFFS